MGKMTVVLVVYPSTKTLLSNWKKFIDSHHDINNAMVKKHAGMPNDVYVDNCHYIFKVAPYKNIITGFHPDIIIADESCGDYFTNEVREHIAFMKNVIEYSQEKGF